MSEDAGTEPREQVDDPINKLEIGSLLHPRRNGCPIASELSYRLEVPPVIGYYGSVYVGGVCLSRDDFCPESDHCVLCSFVGKMRPAATNSVSPKSVHFVLDDHTNVRLREWMDIQRTGETPRVADWETIGLVIAVTNSAAVFQIMYWHKKKAIECSIQKGPGRNILGTLRLWRYQATNSNLPVPRLDTLRYIAKQAKGWLGLCDGTHEVCKSSVSNSTPRISLIDCNRHCLVHRPESVRYVALSYVWGKTGREFISSEREYRVTLDGLPRTITSAIAVTTSLGYDYLWVDMLCIDQQSKEDKDRQIAIMDQIYRSADLTIIVAAGRDCGDGIPGVSERCRPPRLSIEIGNAILVEEKEDAVKEIEASIWRSRGWTFQEGLLSRRRLVFTDSQMSFSCLSGQATEPREGPEFSQEAGSGVVLSNSISMPEQTSLWDTSILKTDSCPRTPLGGDGEANPLSISSYGFPTTLAELLEKYSTLDFSFDSDIVNGFRAIGNTFALRTPPVLHLHGLPFIFDNQSTTASSISLGLAWWLETGNEETVRRVGFPSWSWLGHRRQVRWGPIDSVRTTMPVDRKRYARTFSHVTSMVTNSNKRFDLLELSQWWREWSSAKASEDLAPSRLTILGSMIKQEIWFGVDWRLDVRRGEPSRFHLIGREPVFYIVGHNLMMPEDLCRYLLESLRRGSWQALLLTDNFLLIVQPATASVKGGPYKRVAGADINVSHAEPTHRVKMDSFVKECTETVDIELV